MAESSDDGATGPLGLTLKLNGAVVPDETMIGSVRVTKDIGRIPEAIVSILADGGQVEDFGEIDSSDFQIGSEIEIAAFYGDDAEQTLFKGIVVNTRLRINLQRGTMLELFCRDKALKLQGVRRSGKYEQKKDSDVMTSIISDAGLSADVAATSQQGDQLRINTSDWDFLRLLADRNGQTVHVEGGKITTKAPDITQAAKLTITFGTDMLAYDAVIDAQHMIAKSEHVAWDSTSQDKLSGEDGTLTKPTLGDTSAEDIAKVLGKREMVVPVGAETTVDELKLLSKARLLRACLDAIHGTCSFLGSGKIAPGDMIEIKDVGARFSGTAYVSGLSHTIGAGEWTTQVRMGLPLEWVSDTHGLSGGAASAIATPVPGLHIGVVTKLTEDPENKDRIQVRLPLFEEDGDTLIWARFATPYATKEAGIQFLPEIDDEVLIGFVNDDPNAPMILGALHNGKAARPIEATEENFIKTILTPEKLKIEFDDDKKCLTLETPGGHSVVLDDDGGMIELADSNGNTLTLNSNGITLTSASDITLTATGNIELTATGDAKVSGLNVACEADVEFAGKGGASAEVSAGGTTTVKGAMVMIN